MEANAARLPLLIRQDDILMSEKKRKLVTSAFSVKRAKKGCDADVLVGLESWEEGVSGTKNSHLERGE
jgi:hypothetical protein